jgi:hypothetical protein
MDHGAPPPPLISDGYLNQAIGVCCTDRGRILLSKPVRRLIARYAPTDRPFMNEIPLEQRRQFLDELAQVTGRRRKSSISWRASGSAATWR